VTGAVVSTQKHEKLHGAKLLLVQPISPDGRASGVTVLAVDAAQAGIGDKVLLVIEGRAAGQAVRRRAAPVDAAIVGVIDSVTRYERD
jgi:ethanolamine utilization protein EutN